MKVRTLILVFLMVFIMNNFLLAQASYKVIVNSSNPVSSISKSDLSKLFLKKVTKWENKEKVQVVEQSESSDIRVSFTKEILGKNMSAIKSYWQQQLFSGSATPPVQKDSDESVLKYVADNSGAVGYVSKDADVSKVKVLTIE